MADTRRPELERTLICKMAERMRATLACFPDVFERIELSDYQLGWIACAAFDALKDEAERPLPDVTHLTHSES
jgi:hypothetical protein